MKKWLIFDGRANYDEDEALVMMVCDSKEEAEREKWNYGNDCVVTETEVPDDN